MLHQPRLSHRRPWTPAEDEELKQRCQAGEFLPDIARALGRTQEGCRSRANVLGVSCQSSPRGMRHAAVRRG